MKRFSILLMAVLSMVVVGSMAFAQVQIGVVLPTKDEPRWIQDQNRFEAAFKTAGIPTQILFSQGDTAKEKANVESLISSGAKVIVICPQDGAGAAAAADEARAAGVKVISYDRLILGTASVDYYVTFDSFAVGAAGKIPRQQGHGQEEQPLPVRRGRLRQQRLHLLRRRLEHPPAQDRRRHLRDQEFLRGGEAPRQDDATRDEEGAIIGQVTTNWNFGDAKNKAEANLTSAKKANKGTVFIEAPNDGTARAIADAFRADKDVKKYYITGQDAEVASVQYVIDGKQSMTVLKDVRTLVADAIAAALAFAKGQTPEATTTYDNGKIKVPAKPSAIVTVTKDNVKAAIVDSGYYPSSYFSGLE